MQEGAAPFLAARVELPATTPVPGGRLDYAVVNEGTVPILLGAAYGLERLIDSGWEDVAVPYWFPAWALRLQSGGRRELFAGIPHDAQSGRHRLRVRLLADRDPHPGYDSVARQEIRPIEVSAEFDIRLSKAPASGRSG
jgi:hypothetical protein